MKTMERHAAELVLAQIVSNLWCDFPQLWIFKEAGSQAIHRAWAEGRREGLDDEMILAELLTISGRIGLGGMAMGLIAGYWVGCDAAAKDAGQRRLTDLPERLAN